VRVAVRVRPLLAPLTVTAYEPAKPEHERVDVPLVAMMLSATPVGERVQVRPVDGATPSASETVPTNPSNPVAVIVEVPVAPASMFTLAEPTPTVKSWIV